MPKIEVSHLFKKFTKDYVLDDVSFTIQSGDRFGLIGPNGAGKSTFIDILTGLLQPTAGDILVDGISVKEDIQSIRKKIGLVPQDLALIEELNAVDNLEFFGSMYGLRGKHLQGKMEEALQVIGLTDRKKEKVQKFSGGMKRRLNIAAAILHDPEVLILDEPTVGVDAQSRNYIFDFLRKINKEKKTTILFTSHYMEEVEALCNRIFIIDLGKSVAYGTKESIISMIGARDSVRLVLKEEKENLEEALKDVPGIAAVQGEGRERTFIVDERFDMMQLIATLEQAQAVIESVFVQEPSLEEAFLKLTGKQLRD